MIVIRRLLVLMGLLNVAAIAGIVFQLDGPASQRFDVLPGPGADRQSSPGLHLDTLGVTIDQPNGLQSLFDLLAGPLPFALATLPMIWFAVRLLDRITDTQPFTTETAAGLHRLGRLVLVAGAASELIRGIGTYLLQASVVDPGGRVFALDYTFSFWWLLLGLVLFAFAQIIAYGCTLRAELDEVV